MEIFSEILVMPGKLQNVDSRASLRFQKKILKMLPPVKEGDI